MFYTGAAVNQQAVPAVEYLMSKDGGGYKVLSARHRLCVSAHDEQNSPCHVAGQKSAGGQHHGRVHPFHHQDYQTIVGKIKKFAAGGGAAVISTINGDSNVPFYKEFANQGLRAEDAPIMAFSVAEDELRGMDTTALVGHLAVELLPECRYAAEQEVRGRF